jgi:hypothetical protein
MIDIKTNFEKYVNINCGGCGVFAVEIYKLLKRMNPMSSVEIYILTNRTKKYYDKCSAEIKKGKGYFTVSKLFKKELFINHVVVRLDNYFYDIDGQFTEKELLSKWKCKKLINIPFDDMNTLIKRKDGWNSYFDRSQIKEIRTEFSKII